MANARFSYVSPIAPNFSKVNRNIRDPKIRKMRRDTDDALKIYLLISKYEIADPRAPG